eukprot:Nk52_evm91s352 gene=Nk52_evmTU91s352
MRSYKKCLLIAGLLLCALSTVQPVMGAPTLFKIVLDYPQSGGSKAAGQKAYTGLQIAVEEFTNSSTVEATYWPISETKLDDRSNPELGIINAYDAFKSGIAVFIGAFNSGVTARLALVAKRFNGFIITPGSNSPALSSRTLFPTLTRVTYSSTQIADVYAQICQFYNWEEVGIMHTDDLFATGSAEAFEAAAKARNIKIVYTLTAPFGIEKQGFNLGPGMAELKAATNIYFAAATGQDGTTFMKAGNKAGNWGVEGFQWLVNGFGSTSVLAIPGFDDAPELLKEPPGYYGTQKGDVYAYGIITSEIITRERPYAESQFEPSDILKKVVKRNFRPELPDNLIEELADYIELVWDQDPDDRPDFPHCLKGIKKINPSRGTVMDQMAKVMEKEIKDLELKVNESAQAIADEELRRDSIFFDMVPESIAEQLKLGALVKPEEYEEATMIYTNVVGFPDIIENSKPKELTDFLHSFYMYFDLILSKFTVFQVETIGDTYSIVAGIPERSETHASEAAHVALHLLASMRTFKIRHMPKQVCQLRLGLHTGSAIAGIVGLKRPRYYLFGELVHMAMRMEATGLPLRIHCSEPMERCLVRLGGFKLKYRGEIHATKQTKMKTYWLLGANDFNKKLPDWKDGIQTEF